MKIRRKILLLILFLVIGAAAVSTSLFVNGIIGIASNDDFDVIFTSAISESGGSASISDDGKTITYSTKNLTIVDEKARLNFVVKNTSTQYDADVILNCVLDDKSLDLQDYITFDYAPKSKFNLQAQESKNGNVVIKLAKAYVGEDKEVRFTCNISANAIEKDSLATENKNFNYSVYSWYDVPFVTNNISETVDFLKEKDIGDIYHSFGDENLNNKYVKEEISYLTSNGFDVYFLTGKPSHYQNQQALKEKIDSVVQYNSEVTDDKRIKGIVFDIEPYVNEQFKSNIVEEIQVYANTLEETYAYAKESDLQVVNVIPYWYDDSYLDGSDYSSEEKVLIENALRKIFINSDRVSVMNYYKKSMVESIRYEVALAEELGVEIESIAAFGRPKGDSIPNTVTMWVEDEPFAYANQKWEDISNEYANVKCYSYHDLSSMLALSGSYKEYNFEFIDNSGNVLDVDEVMVEFSDGSYDSLSTTKEATLPLNEVMSFSIYGYKVLAESVSDVEDRLAKVTLTVEAYDKYTLEIYPKLFNGVDYDGITSGKVILKNDKFHIVLEKEITDKKYVVLKVFSDTAYEVEVLDSDGNIYTFEYADAKNEVGERKIISSDNKILIPKNFKSSLYVGPSFYVK